MSRRYEGKDFMDLVKKTPIGCWIWQGYVHQNGMPVWKGWESALKVAWAMVKGRWPANTRIAGRICGNTRCVNPEHFRLQKFISKEYDI